MQRWVDLANVYRSESKVSVSSRETSRIVTQVRVKKKWRKYVVSTEELSKKSLIHEKMLLI